MLKTMQFNNISFKEIPGFDGRYFVSKTGDVLSLVFGTPKLLSREPVILSYVW